MPKPEDTGTPPAGKTSPNTEKEGFYTTFTVIFFGSAVIIITAAALLLIFFKAVMSVSSPAILILLIAGGLSAVAGFLCLDASNPSAPELMPPHDRRDLIEEISKGNTAAIELYLRLRNIRGVAGFFQKLGLSGLPIATIFVTLVFTILAVNTAGKTSETLFDLAKLTIGAFIGSFVTRPGSKDDPPKPSQPPPP
jgi:hypothetical protein